MDADALVVFIETCRDLGRGALKAETAWYGSTQAVATDDALDIFDRQLDHIEGWVTAHQGSLATPPASDSGLLVQDRTTE